MNLQIFKTIFCTYMHFFTKRRGLNAYFGHEMNPLPIINSNRRTCLSHGPCAINSAKTTAMKKSIIREKVAFNLDCLYMGGLSLGVRYKF